MSLRNRLRVCGLILGCLTATVLAHGSDAGLQITDTSKFDELDTVNQAPGGGGVAIFNGSLALTAESIIGLPHDGGLTLGLSRTYNSTNVRRYKVFNDGVPKVHVAGRSWSGLGLQASSRHPRRMP